MANPNLYPGASDARNQAQNSLNAAFGGPQAAPTPRMAQPQQAQKGVGVWDMLKAKLTNPELGAADMQIDQQRR